MLKQQLKENIISVLPIVIIVLLLNFTIAPIENYLIYRFLIGSFVIIVGLTIFLIGVNIGITPTGSYFGKVMAKSNKLLLLILASAILGFFISIAEPALIIFSNQVELASSGEIASLLMLVVVSIGMGLLISIGLARIIYNFSLNKLLTIVYAIIFILALFSTKEFLAISFDASGATTGLLAVPFMLALALGVSSLKKDSHLASSDSFGLVGLASAGAIISFLFYGVITSNKSFNGVGSEVVNNKDILAPFITDLPITLFQSLIAITPLLIIFLILQKVSFKLNKKQFLRIFIGFIYSFIGLVLFLLGVNAGFMELGSNLGGILTDLGKNYIVLIVGFILGVVTIIAEPSVHVLVKQVEEVTSGSIKKKPIITALALGVGFAIVLSIVRVLVPAIKLWHFLLPGYILALILSYIAPKLFVGLAFDAGGVSTGPITTTFILAFMQGVSKSGTSMLAESFGMIALVALAPIITLQVLGIVYEIKSKRRLKINAKS